MRSLQELEMSDFSRLQVINVLKELRHYVTIDRFPKKKSSVIKFNLPQYVQGLSLNKYLSVAHGLTQRDQDFLLDNLKYCRYIQPVDSFVIIGTSDPQVKPIIIDTTEYGKFHIYGTKSVNVTDPEDIKSSLTSYICSRGVTAFVHVYRFRGNYITAVYYSNEIAEVIGYAKLMATPSLFKNYADSCMGELSAG